MNKLIAFVLVLAFTSPVIANSKIPPGQTPPYMPHIPIKMPVGPLPIVVQPIHPHPHPRPKPHKPPVECPLARCAIVPFNTGIK